MTQNHCVELLSPWFNQSYSYFLFPFLNIDFPEVVANLIIDGRSHDITPENNTNTNTWDEAITASRHNDTSKTQTEHLKDFSTWSVRSAFASKLMYCVAKYPRI